MYLSHKPKIFYGYWILVAAFLCLFIWAGSGYFGFSLFVTSLEADFGWSRGEIMAAFTIFYLVQGMASPFIGRVVDRYGVRGVISVGAFITGLGFVLLSLMSKIWYFYLGWAVVGAGMAAMGTVPTSAAVSNWFKKRRGIAIGILTIGSGAGGFALTPLIGGYLIPHFGWRMSYLVLALITCVFTIPLALLVMRTKPADMGLYPDGIKAPETVAAAETLRLAIDGLSLKAALTTSALWLIGISFLTSALGRNAILQNQVPYLEDIGFPIATAATALGIVALGVAISRLVFGWLCDIIQEKYIWCICLGLHLVSIATLMNVGPASPVALIWLYAATMGLGGGGWLPSLLMLTSATFGLASYGTLFGMLSFLQSIGIAAGPLIAGYMYDVMNTYHWVFILSLVLCAVAIPAILAVRRPKSP